MSVTYLVGQGSRMIGDLGKGNSACAALRDAVRPGRAPSRNLASTTARRAFRCKNIVSAAQSAVPLLTSSTVREPRPTKCGAAAPYSPKTCQFPFCATFWETVDPLIGPLIKTPK